MKKYDVSICLPAHRNHYFQRLYNSISPACGEYSWELVLVGPNDPPKELLEKSNFKFFKDYGSPARSAQIAVMLAEGTLMMWGSDDGLFLKDSIKECIDLYRVSAPIDAITIRYCEGVGMTGKMPVDDYWRAWHHDDQRLPGIPQDYKIAPAGMYNTDYFRWLGGWDCRYEHINMCTHDLAFRAQRHGSKFHLSPSQVINCDFDYADASHAPVQAAYDYNDKALFTWMYSQDQSSRINIDYYNWIDSPSVWARRFGNKA